MGKLHNAVVTRNTKSVSRILKHPNARDIVDSVDENGQTALNLALSADLNYIIGLLVRGGAYISVEDLLLAARHSNTNFLRKLCGDGRTRGQVINRTDANGWTALQRAIAEYLGSRIVLTLLENGADPIPVDPEGSTVLVRAIRNFGDNEVIVALLEKGADPNVSSPDHWTVLHTAVIYDRDWSIVASLLRRGADPNAINPYGQTVLHAGNFICRVSFPFVRNSSHLCFHLVIHFVPALYKQLDLFIIYTLVISGGNVDITDSKGYTVLHRAIKMKGRGNSNIIFIKCLLIAAATDCNAPTRDGKSALHLHARYGGGADASSEKIVNIFNSLQTVFGTGRANGIELRIRNGSLVSALIHAGADVDLMDLAGATPLYYAAAYGNLSIVEALVRRNADPNLTDRNLMFPLDIALKCGFKEVVETLVSAGADVNAFNGVGRTPLLHAVTMVDGNVFVNIFIRHDCDVDLRNPEGATALHLAATRGNCAAMNALLDANANTNIQDYKGMTPLHYAICTTYPSAMASLNSLFRKGFDMQITDREGRTALHRAAVIGADLNIIYRLIRRDPTQVTSLKVSE